MEVLSNHWKGASCTKREVRSLLEEAGTENWDALCLTSETVDIILKLYRRIRTSYRQAGSSCHSHMARLLG